MIIIDGRQSSVSLSNYANLEEVLTQLVEEESLEHRIVTDVLVNDTAFSELYPHQAEDMPVQGIQRLEVRSISMEEMATDVLVELPKVIHVMAQGSRRVAALLREYDLAEGLEVLQDTISVSRDFLQTLYVLRSQFPPAANARLDALRDVLGGLLDEIAEVMQNEDWILVADLLEYEYLPACEGWRGIISELSVAEQGA